MQTIYFTLKSDHMYDHSSLTHAVCKNRKVLEDYLDKANKANRRLLDSFINGTLHREELLAKSNSMYEKLRASRKFHKSDDIPCSYELIILNNLIDVIDHWQEYKERWPETTIIEQYEERLDYGYIGALPLIE